MRIKSCRGTAPLYGVVPVVLVGCASIQSGPEHTNQVISDGLVYRMPMRQIQISVTVPKAEAKPDRENIVAPQDPKRHQESRGGTEKGAGGVNGAGGGQDGSNPTGDGVQGGTNANGQSGGTQNSPAAPAQPHNNSGNDEEKDQVTIPIQVAATAAYPDLRHRFVLKYQTNLVGKNELDIAIKENGLLTSTGAKTTSGVSEFLTSLATARGALKVRSFASKAPADCQEGQTYQVVIDPAEDELTCAWHLCNFEIKVVRLFDQAQSVGKSSARAVPEDDSKKPNESGVFYRQSLPYKVTVQELDAPANARDFIVFSPSEAPISFVPIRRTFFANNDATIAFNDGMPTSYKQAADGELVALAKLPANILSAYFGAIGEVFKKRSATITTEQNYLASLNALAAERIKRQTCKEAVLGSKTDEEILAACAPAEEEDDGTGGSQ